MNQKLTGGGKGLAIGAGVMRRRSDNLLTLKVNLDGFLGCPALAF